MLFLNEIIAYPMQNAVLQSISGMLEHSGIRVNDFGLSPRAKIEFCIENY